MLRARPPITREQLELCKAYGMSPSQAGTHLGRHHTTILAACEKFDIELPKYAHRYAAPTFKKRLKSSENDPKPVKTWSASPEAIERALAKLQKGK